MLALAKQSAGLVNRASNPVCLSFVRFRKRRDRPMAKSKFFRVNEKVPQDPDEKVEMMRRRNHYSTEMRAIKKLFKEQFIQRGASSSSMSELELQKYEDSDFQRMLHFNEQWNTELAKQREIRTAKDMLDQEARSKGAIERIDTETLEDLLQKEEEVRIMKEKVKDFVTLENLDEKIEEVLNTKVDYNFSIDLDGNTRKPPPEEQLFSLNQDEMNTRIEQTGRKVINPTDIDHQ